MLHTTESWEASFSAGIRVLDRSLTARSYSKLCWLRFLSAPTTRNVWNLQKVEYINSQGITQDYKVNWFGQVLTSTAY